METDKSFYPLIIICNYMGTAGLLGGVIIPAKLVPLLLSFLTNFLLSAVFFPGIICFKIGSGD
jgi:hypothetical protein